MIIRIRIKVCEEKMDRICEYIILSSNSDNALSSFSTTEIGIEMNMSIDEQCQKLNEILGSSISNLERFDDNWGCQRKVMISFEYNGRKYNIKEHFGTQRDYLCVDVE